jgi:hypothetical protein
LTLNSFSIVDPVPFSLSSQSLLRLPLTLKPGESDTLQICFHPSQVATYSSEADWTTNIDHSFDGVMKPKSFLHGVAIEKKSKVIQTENDFHFSLNPNPVTGNMLKVSLSEVQSHPISLSIYDLLGREMTRQEIAAGTNEAEISIQDLPEGMYYVRLTSEGKVFSCQFVKN